jgi:hypothetical protein
MDAVEAMREVLPHRRDRGRRLLRHAQRDAEMLVDVGVDRDHRRARGHQMPHEQRGQRRLSAAALTDKSDLHGPSQDGRAPTGRRHRHRTPHSTLADGASIELLLTVTSPRRADPAATARCGQLLRELYRE